MVNADRANLRSSVFFVWGGLCTCAFVYSYFLVPETKVHPLLLQTIHLKQFLISFQGLSLEQVDKMMEETSPRTSSKWRPRETFASRAGTTEDDKPDAEDDKPDAEHVPDVEGKESV